jgi:hypothetical protein
MKELGQGSEEGYYKKEHGSLCCYYSVAGLLFWQMRKVIPLISLNKV